MIRLKDILNEISVRDVILKMIDAIEFARDASTEFNKYVVGGYLDYVKGYTSSMLKKAKKNPKNFAKDYKGFDKKDWVKDIISGFKAK